MNRKYLLGGVASAALMAATASVNAAIVQTSLKLTDDAGAELPKIGEIYQIPVGTTFNVVLGGQVNQPNMTDQARTNVALRNQPLGLQNLTVDIISQGAGKVTPVAAAGTTQWDDSGAGVYTDLTTDVVGYPFVNLIDRNGDGNVDVAGAGFNHQGFALGTTGVLPRYQYGATGQMDFLQGDFRATTAGAVTLRTSASSANVYVDPATGGANDVQAQDLLGTVVNGTIQINVTGGDPGKKEVKLGSTANTGTAIPLVITGGNGRYVSSTATVSPPATIGNVNLSAIGSEGPVLVMIQFTDTNTATGPALDDAFLNSIDLGAGNTRLLPGSAAFEALNDHYQLLNQPGAALFQLNDPARILNFDFTDQGGIAVAAIAAVPEPGVIGALAVAGFGLLARRRRHA